MSENKKPDVVSLLFIAAAALLALVILLLVANNHRLRKELDAYKNAPADTVTVVKHDTIKIDSPVPVYKYIKEKEYITITDSSIVVDTVIRDTVIKFIQLPREYLVYKDTNYRAVVSGVQPRLDSIEIYRPTITNTITKYVEVKKKTRWGLGVQAGYGYNGKNLRPYIGAGVQYNIISW